LLVKQRGHPPRGSPTYGTLPIGHGVGQQTDGYALAAQVPNQSNDSVIQSIAGEKTLHEAIDRPARPPHRLGDHPPGLISAHPSDTGPVPGVTLEHGAIEICRRDAQLVGQRAPRAGIFCPLDNAPPVKHQSADHLLPPRPQQALYLRPEPQGQGSFRRMGSCGMRGARRGSLPC